MEGFTCGISLLAFLCSSLVLRTFLRSSCLLYPWNFFLPPLSVLYFSHSPLLPSSHFIFLNQALYLFQIFFFVRIKALSVLGDVISSADIHWAASILVSQNLILFLLLQPTIQALKKSILKFLICFSASRITGSFISNGNIEFREPYRENIL